MQEVTADDTPAIAMVLSADRESAALRAEARRLERAGPGPPPTTDRTGPGPAEERLKEVYSALEARGDRTAESRARSILFGLGFPQVSHSLLSHTCWSLLDQ